ncbi:MAG: VOC family protein [Hyphomicrobiales bacterium]
MARRGRPPANDVLTPAEWQVLHGVRHGMTNRRIAALRGVSTGAIKYHLENMRAKLGIESRAALRSWPGQPAAMRERRTAMANESPALGHIGQVSLSVKDIDVAVAFYRDVLGLQHLFTAGQLAFFDCEGTRLFLDALPEAQRQGNSVLYFTVREIEAATKALEAKGVVFTSPPHMIHRHENGVEEWMSFFADPEGNTLALMSQVAPAG